MMPATPRWTASSGLLAGSGILLIGVGIYFLFLRPAMLPEDIRFMSLTPTELQVVGPRLEAWLTHVFRVMGGYIFATGILAVTLAATSFRARHVLAASGATLGGAASIGLMAAVNFAIGSDFKWILLAMALIWAGSIGAYLVESLRGALERSE
jgi:hypothetical protein